MSSKCLLFIEIACWKVHHRHLVFSGELSCHKSNFNVTINVTLWCKRLTAEADPGKRWCLISFQQRIDCNCTCQYLSVLQVKALVLSCLKPTCGRLHSRLWTLALVLMEPTPRSTDWGCNKAVEPHPGAEWSWRISRRWGEEEAVFSFPSNPAWKRSLLL